MMQKPKVLLFLWLIKVKDIFLGIKYDVVVLDACDNTKELPCPSKSFLSTEALTNIRSILKPMGTFIINVLPLDNQKINIEMVGFLMCFGGILMNDS